MVNDIINKIEIICGEKCKAHVVHNDSIFMSIGKNCYLYAYNINTHEPIVKENKYVCEYGFNETTVVVKENKSGSYGLLNYDGYFVLDVEYEYIIPLMASKKHYICGDKNLIEKLIDCNGEVAMHEKYTCTQMYINSDVVVVKLVNKEGARVEALFSLSKCKLISKGYISITVFNEVIIAQNRYKGILSKTGKELLKPIYNFDYSLKDIRRGNLKGKMIFLDDNILIKWEPRSIRVANYCVKKYNDYVAVFDSRDRKVSGVYDSIQVVDKNYLIGISNTIETQDIHIEIPK